MTTETLRKWVRPAEVDSGQAPGDDGVCPGDPELRWKNAELEQASQILEAATFFFVRECDPPRR